MSFSIGPVTQQPAASQPSSFQIDLRDSEGQMGALLEPDAPNEIGAANDTPASSVLATIQKYLRNQKRLYKYYTGPGAIHAEVEQGGRFPDSATGASFSSLKNSDAVNKTSAASPQERQNSKEIFFGS